MKSKLKKKRAGRKRRAAGWTLLALGLLVAAAWGASGWWSTSYGATSSSVSIHHGITYIVWDELNASTRPNGLRIEREKPNLALESQRFYWWYGFLQRHDNRLTIMSFGVGYLFAVSNSESFVLFAFWPIPLLLWTPAALLLRSGIIARRRAVGNMCKKCGYDLAGLPAGSPCPECGKGAGTK